MLGSPLTSPHLTRSLVLGAALALTGALGCSAVINPDPARLGAPVARPDAGPADAGIVLRLDSGPRRDTGTGPCSGEPFCEGAVSVVCAANGAFERINCAGQGGTCAEGRCVDSPGCEQGARRCDADRSRVLECGPDGTEFTVEECGAGQCVPEGAFCEGDPPRQCEGLQRIRPGESDDVDLCEREDSETYVTGMGCNSNQRADIGDRVFELEIEHAGRYVIQLEDADDFRRVDTVLYLRNACDRPGTQFQCADDTPCSDTIPNPFSDCIGGIDYGRSRIVVDLQPGTYYVVVDGFEARHNNRDWGCGTVSLEVAPAER